MRILTAQEMKEVENRAQESGISFLQLMENAGSYCARIIRKTFENTTKRRVLIVCGKGKNGGDGCVIARKLSEDGYKVSVMMAQGLPSDEISSEMLSRVRAMGIGIMYYDKDGASDRAFSSAEIIVDCVFGIGFRGETNSACSSLFEKINKSSATVVSIDLPSGLYCDSGECNPNSVKADLTVAISSLKPVHILKPARYNCGEVVTAPIGIPEKCYNPPNEGMFTLSAEEIGSMFKKRDPQSHKGTYGTALIIGGSYEMPNAAVMAAQSAVNCGAGLVKLAFPSTAYKAIAPKTAEQVLIPLESNKNGRISSGAVKRLEYELKKCTCVAIGCGMGVDSDTREIVKYVLENAEVPVIVDADGINCLADCIELIDRAKSDVILTPHPKEFSRIAKKSVEEIERDRASSVNEFIREHKAVLVLKGSATLTAEKGSALYINSTGNAGMARGGSGDVLTGIIAGFSAQGYSAFNSAAAGVNIHGRAGDSVAAEYSELGCTPTLMLKALPKTLKICE